MSAEERIHELDLMLPPIAEVAGVYKPIITVGNFAFLSGHGPVQSDGSLITGKIGEDMDLEGGCAAARQTGLSLLATMQFNLGSLDKVKRIVKTLGFVNSTDDFVHQPQVINGCSELFAEVFGDQFGIGARSAISTNSLPGNISVEIEVIIEIK